MTQPETIKIDIRTMSAGEVLAHALELTQDSADRYAQLQACLEAHHNEAAAATLRQIVTYSLATAEAISRNAALEQLPKIAPWQLCWRCADLIAAPAETAATPCDHQISASELLRLALRREHCALSCFQDAQAEVASDASRKMLSEIALRQSDQIAQLEKLLAAAETTDEPAPADLDPPNRPD